MLKMDDLGLMESQRLKCDEERRAVHGNPRRGAAVEGNASLRPGRAVRGERRHVQFFSQRRIYIRRVQAAPQARTTVRRRLAQRLAFRNWGDRDRSAGPHKGDSKRYEFGSMPLNLTFGRNGV